MRIATLNDFKNHIKPGSLIRIKNGKFITFEIFISLNEIEKDAILYKGIVFPAGEIHNFSMPQFFLDYALVEKII